MSKEQQKNDDQPGNTPSVISDTDSKRTEGVFSGVVVSDKPDKTIIVRVERVHRHPVYQKKITTSKKYAVHDENNTYRTGDTVTFKASRPISKRKKWSVVL